MKYKIKHSNTDIKKLWNLAKNGHLSYSTVHKIFENDVDGYIVFNSKQTYEKFVRLQYSASAMF